MPVETGERTRVGAEAPATALLRVRGVGKSFGHVRALAGVDLELEAGEVVAVVGDNGAGKSTLLKVIAGAVTPSAGSIELRGRPMSFRTPADARRAGIAAVFQDLALVESLDIATNVFLGDLPRRGPFVDRRRIDHEAREILDRMGGASRSPRTAVGLLPAGHRQVIAVARAVRSNCDVVVMDEPTAALGYSEKAQVADIIHRLRAEGKALVIVSHDLELVFEVADRIEVLRLGQVAGVRRRAETDRDEIVGLITGARS